VLLKKQKPQLESRLAWCPGGRINPKAGSPSTDLEKPQPAFNQRLTQAVTVTLLELKNSNTRTSVQRRLQYLAKHTDIFDPMKTKAHIEAKTVSDGYKQTLFVAYQHFCDSNQIPFDMPHVDYTPAAQIIPTTDQVNTILGCTTPQMSTPLTILSETAIEGEELHQVTLAQIDLEEGTISVKGTKGHANGVYKLRPRTADMLRRYLARRSDTAHPFPTTKVMSQSWRVARRRASAKFCRPELLKIPMKNLRNYAGSVFYKTTGRHDPIATMRFMRHKQLDTTMRYLRLINLDEPEEYVTKVVQIGTPDTIKQITELSNAGYEKVTEADGYQVFRIRKT